MESMQVVYKHEMIGIAKTAPDALKTLWKDKFFETGKSQKETEQELHSRGYNFGGATRKALERAKFLTTQGGHEERKFIQKYPFDEGSQKT